MPVPPSKALTHPDYDDRMTRVLRRSPPVVGWSPSALRAGGVRAAAGRGHGEGKSPRRGFNPRSLRQRQKYSTMSAWSTLCATFPQTVSPTRLRSASSRLVTLPVYSVTLGHACRHAARIIMHRVTA